MGAVRCGTAAAELARARAQVHDASQELMQLYERQRDSLPPESCSRLLDLLR